MMSFSKIATNLLPPLLCLGLTLPASAAYNLRDNVMIHAQKATTWFEREHYPEAIAEYQIAIRLDPHAAIAASLYNNLGLAFMKTQQYPKAITSFQRAIRIQPDFELYYKNLIRTYAVSGVLPLAQNRLQDIVTRNPIDAEAWFLLGLAYEQAHETQAAKAAFAKFLALNPYSQLADAAKSHL